jgi:hypothetical protein
MECKRTSKRTDYIIILKIIVDFSEKNLMIGWESASESAEFSPFDEWTTPLPFFFDRPP